MNELVVSAKDDGLRIGLLEGKRIVELHHEKTNKYFSVGDIFLGKVKKIVPGLNATFVDIGHPKDAFLHYFDLGPQVNSLQKYVRIVNQSKGKFPALAKFHTLPDIDKHGKIGNVLKNNQRILVQVVKEAISTKGPRLACEISLPGKYMILVPFAKDVSVSRKIGTSGEKKRLKVLAESIKPNNCGLIIRTAAEGKDVKALDEDLKGLLAKWDKLTKSVVQTRSIKKVLSEEQRTTSILRDMLSIGFDRIITDDKTTFDDIQEFLKSNMPEKAKILKFYNGKAPLFQHMHLEKQIKASFGKTVTMQNGSYLVIEHTEAMHVIDVNSGSKNLSGETLEDNALRTNLEAAREIARQLRLRDMGGIIVIDFIDLRKVENKKKLFAELKSAMNRDRAKHSILPMSRFGLIQITRQRVRPELNIKTTEVCPSCTGTGKIQPAILIADEIAANVDFLMKQNKESGLTLYVNPYVEAYLKKGLLNFPIRWLWKYKSRVKIISDNSIGFSEVRYYSSKGEEIKI